MCSALYRINLHQKKQFLCEIDQWQKTPAEQQQTLKLWLKSNPLEVEEAVGFKHLNILKLTGSTDLWDKCSDQSAGEDSWTESEKQYFILPYFLHRSLEVLYLKEVAHNCLSVCVVSVAENEVKVAEQRLESTSDEGK